MLLKFYAVDDHCGTKARSEFRAMEERFDSLDDCCRVKFPQSVSDCCETGDGDCSLSGSMKYIPVSSFSQYLLYLSNKVIPDKIIFTIEKTQRNGKTKFVTPRMKTYLQDGNVHFPNLHFGSAVNITCIMM